MCQEAQSSWQFLRKVSQELERGLVREVADRLRISPFPIPGNLASLFYGLPSEYYKRLAIHRRKILNSPG